MSDGFDPYIEWLGILPAEGPVDHYALLGIARFESDTSKIIQAADARMELLRRFQTGARSVLSQEILNEVSGARICLLDKKQRDKYDQQLRERVDIKSLPPLRPSAIFPDEIPSAEIYVLAMTSETSDPDQWLIPKEPEPSKSKILLPHIPYWVYFVVIGIASVMLMSYGLYRSISGVSIEGE
jgi:hypothetical protein